MSAYYNEVDAYAAQWLRNLIARGLIATGDVDERSIIDVRADDVRGYAQCHFFAGIGGWSIALRLAGWSDDRPVWTGSCPCQPFSSAGAGKAADDQRHLWPAWFPLIAECRPAIVFGEQVEAAIGWGWLDAVFADLESQSYACASAILPACGVGAPHIRQRLWFVADNQCQRPHSAVASSRTSFSLFGKSVPAHEARSSELADADPPGRSIERRGGLLDGERPALRDDADGRGWMGDANQPGLPLRERQDISGPWWRQEGRAAEQSGGASGFWDAIEWLPCTDGKARPVEPGSFPLAHGVQRRASKLRAYGNAVVPQIAAAFIEAASGDRP